jgi:hypothetical protein
MRIVPKRARECFLRGTRRNAEQPRVYQRMKRQKGAEVCNVKDLISRRIALVVSHIAYRIEEVKELLRLILAHMIGPQRSALRRKGRGEKDAFFGNARELPDEASIVLDVFHNVNRNDSVEGFVTERVQRANYDSIPSKAWVQVLTDDPCRRRSKFNGSKAKTAPRIEDRKAGHYLLGREPIPSELTRAATGVNR